VIVQVVIMAALFVSLLWWNFGHRMMMVLPAAAAKDA
jgi:hypothetical protein